MQELHDMLALRARLNTEPECEYQIWYDDLNGLGNCMKPGAWADDDIPYCPEHMPKHTKEIP